MTITSRRHICSYSLHPVYVREQSLIDKHQHNFTSPMTRRECMHVDADVVSWRWICESLKINDMWSDAGITRSHNWRGLWNNSKDCMSELVKMADMLHMKTSVVKTYTSASTIMILSDLFMRLFMRYKGSVCINLKQSNFNID